MARYDYRCPACHHVFEVEHSMDKNPLVTCPQCGQKAERVFEPSGISLKGSGFYNTDSKNSGSTAHEKTTTQAEKNVTSHSSERDKSPSDTSSASTAKETSAKDTASTSSSANEA